MTGDKKGTEGDLTELVTRWVWPDKCHTSGV